MDFKYLPNDSLLCACTTTFAKEERLMLSSLKLRILLLLYHIIICEMS